MRCVIVGTSMISRRFIAALAEVRGAEAYGVCSRSWMRGKAFAGEYAIPMVYESLEEALEDRMVEVVYLASPNGMHYGQAKMALAAGRHVICEKPLFTSIKEFMDIRNMLETSDAYFFEAIITMYLPHFHLIKKAMKELGRIHAVNLSYFQYSSRYEMLKAGEMTNVFDPVMGGGCLWDLTVYGIHSAVGLLGVPDEVVARGIVGWGAEVTDSLILTYPETLCSISCSKGCPGPLGTSIQGERGWLEVTGAPSFCSQVFLHKGDERVELSSPGSQQENRMIYQLAEFFRAIEEKDRTAMNAALDHSQRVMEVLEKAWAQIAPANG